MNVPITRTHEEAVEKIKEMAPTEIAFVPIPCRGDFSFYATKTGEIYQIRDIKEGSTYRQMPVCNNAVQFRTAGKRNKTSVTVANMVYSAFVAKEFHPVRRFKYKDGNPNNYSLDNIVLKGGRDYTAIAQRMEDLSELFVANRAKFISNVRYRYFIDVKTAEDIVEEAFILLCNKGIKEADEAYFCGAIYKSIVAIRQIYRNRIGSRFCQLNEHYDVGVEEAEMSELLPFAMRRLESEQTHYALYLWSIGYTRDEITGILGKKRTTIDGRISRAIKACSKDMKRDAEIYYSL